MIEANNNRDVSDYAYYVDNFVYKYQEALKTIGNACVDVSDKYDPAQNEHLFQSYVHLVDAAFEVIAMAAESFFK